MLPLRLHAKFLVLVLGSLIIFLGTLAVYLINREARLLERKAEEKQHVLAFAIYSDLKESMIEGTPRRTLGLMQNIRGNDDVVRLEVVRKDGTRAFGVQGEPIVLPQLAQPFVTGLQVSFLENNANNPVHTILYPLRNDPVCSSCHSAGERILGVLILSLSWENSLREVGDSRRTLTVFFAVLIAMIGGVLYYLVRHMVLLPLAALHEGADRIGRGELGHRVRITTNDEIQELSESLNAMAGRLEESYAGLELTVRERTAEVEEKATRLYEYSRDMATISRLSTKVFNAEQPLDQMLDRFVWAVTRGLGYKRSMLCLIDRKQARLEVKRDSGLGAFIALGAGHSFQSEDPFAQLVRSGKEALVLDASVDPVFREYVRNKAAPLSLVVMPIRTGGHKRRCWEIKSCVQTACPVYGREDEPCWIQPGTCCSSSMSEQFADKIPFCMTCEVFPVLGVLIVASRSRHAFRRRDVNVLRILAAEMGSALENQMLHEDNRQVVRDLLELHNVTAAALADLSLDRSLEAFTDSAMKFSGIDACNFWLLSDDGRWLLRKTGAGPEQQVPGWPERLPADKGPLGRALVENRAVAEYDLAANDATDLGRSARARGMKGVLALPLQTPRRPLGVFSVHKKGTLPFLEREIVAFMLLANQAAMAMNVCMLNAELKTQNRELASNISLMRGILSSMSSGVLLLSRDGIIRLVNPAGAELLHTRPEDMIGRSITELFPETSQFLATSPGLYQEIDVLRRSGTTISLGFSTSRITLDGDGQEGTIVVYRDLTEIKSLQAAVLTKERFAAMGQVVAGVAHEIRNPLFGISSIGQIFERELAKPAHLELVGALLSETRRLNELVEELLIYGRPVKLSLADSDLSALWREAISMHREELEQKGIAIRAELSQTMAYIDPNQMRQVFLNLFRNAVDATPRGGAISIRLLLEDRSIIFSITDTGPGIPGHQQSKVFDLFYTTKAKGTGLGLAICKKIVEDHGGVISVTSPAEQGPDGPRGTIVTIKMPYRVAFQVPPAL